MKTTGKITGMLALLLLVGTALALGGCKKDDAAAEAAHTHEMRAHAAHSLDEEITPPEGAGAYADLRPVATDRVCMVNDQVFSDPQIPVKVDGKTYYGCCPACKAMLEQDRSMRVAVDPVTGEEVDKATASIGAFSDGSVLYFASAANRDAFDPATMR